MINDFLKTNLIFFKIVFLSEKLRKTTFLTFCLFLISVIGLNWGISNNFKELERIQTEEIRKPENFIYFIGFESSASFKAFKKDNTFKILNGSSLDTTIFHDNNFDLYADEKFLNSYFKSIGIEDSIKFPVTNIVETNAVVKQYKIHINDSNHVYARRITDTVNVNGLKITPKELKMSTPKFCSINRVFYNENNVFFKLKSSSLDSCIVSKEKMHSTNFDIFDNTGISYPLFFLVELSTDSVLKKVTENWYNRFDKFTKFSIDSNLQKEFENHYIRYKYLDLGYFYNFKNRVKEFNINLENTNKILVLMLLITNIILPIIIITVVINIRRRDLEFLYNNTSKIHMVLIGMFFSLFTSLILIQYSFLSSYLNNLFYLLTFILSFFVILFALISIIKEK